MIKWPASVAATFMCFGMVVAHAQSSLSQLQTELISPWLATVAGESRPRTLRILGVEQSDSGTFVLNAVYAYSDSKPVAVKAEIIQAAQVRTLLLTTQSNATIAAIQKPDGAFVGTFTDSSGRTKELRIEKVSEAELIAKVEAALKGTTISKPAGGRVEREIAGFKFYEETITTNVPYMTGFFVKEEKQIPITGVLWTPYGNHPKPYPLVINSHGSQDGGVEINVEPMISRVFLEKGYAVFYPLRKGFNRKGTPPSEVRADFSEPIQCNNYSSSEDGLQSAIADVKALHKTLTARTDIDLTNVTLMGISRGGFLSLATAAEGLPGVRRILNFSGGWYSEKCYSGFNYMKFEYFAKKIKSPILSFYGDNDSYYSLDHVRSNLQALDKGGMNRSHILPGGGHGLLFRNPEFWIPLVFPDYKQTSDNENVQ